MKKELTDTKIANILDKAGYWKQNWHTEPAKRGWNVAVKIAKLSFEEGKK